MKVPREKRRYKGWERPCAALLLAQRDNMALVRICAACITAKNSV